jgi:hypothetical protein
MMVKSRVMPVARRLVVVLALFALPSCGLILDFDGFTGNDSADGPSPETPDEGTKQDATAKDSPANEADAPPCVPPAGSDALACDIHIDSLAATGTAVLWTAQRGVVVRDLATSAERIVAPRPTTANDSTVAVAGDTFYVGWSTPEPSAVLSCASPCATLTALSADPVAKLRKLAASAAGLYALQDVGNASELVAIPASTFHPQTGETAQIGVTHFVVSDTRAYWRDSLHEKHMCPLPDCAPDKAQSTGKAPFRPLSGDQGFASLQLGKSGGAAAWICQSDGETCAETQPLGIGIENYNPDATDGIFKNEKAIAVAEDDFVYVGGTASGKLEIGKVAGAPDGGYTSLRTLDGAEVTALAVNGTDVFVAVTAGGQSLLYRFPR